MTEHDIRNSASPMTNSKSQEDVEVTLVDCVL